ncbi:beta-lactamase/transpeptidase-like protein [Paraphoma chrysanthemicola]|uniref:Beta-lactamase/transpeptidase-like protein n=1 Tax=Paraphoma chrysanthemicola TaxID=798071 RepID=A0A8K0QVH1_9PLEO|nr:beta-lactamase/transpeptidase-like protein [Paraphoma chrysanthemicola]
MHPFHALFFSSLTLQVTASTWTGCPPAGPLLPRPTQLSESSILRKSRESFETTLEKALNGSISSGFSVENTSFSLGLVTPDTSKPIWQYHHRGSANVNGTSVVDGDTQYLIGSISKLITDLLVLRTGIDLDTPVTQYLPKLVNTSSIVKWEEVTLASLADHLSGIPPNYGFSEFYFLQPFLERLGFPLFDPAVLPKCGVTGLNRACSQDQLLAGMSSVRPITQSNTRPVYSQLSFTLLSYALSAKYNLTYPELIKKYITQPFNLTNTGVSPGNSSLAVIPPIESSWGAEYGDSAPGGGLYSSLNDLSIIARAILDRTALSSASEVRAWLNPRSETSSPFYLVGRPWEIFRSQNLTPAYPHTIDIYGKNGGAYGYTSQFSLIDSYGIGIVVLTAGPPQGWTRLYDAILSVFLPAVEEEARAQAKQFTSNFTSSDNLVEMTLAIDDGPGLKLSRLSRNDSDILTGISQVYAQALPQFGNLSTDFRIFPTDIVQESSLTLSDNTNIPVTKEDWRINFDFLPNTAENSGSELPGQGARQLECTAWQTVDWFYYGNEAVDRVVVIRNGEGVVIGWEIPFLRAVVLKAVE